MACPQHISHLFQKLFFVSMSLLGKDSSSVLQRSWFFFFFQFALGFSDLLYTAAHADAKAVSSWKITMVQYLCVRISLQKLMKTFFKAVPPNKVQLKFRNHIYFRKAEINQTIYLSMFYLFLLVATVYCFPNIHTLTPIIPGR